MIINHNKLKGDIGDFYENVFSNISQKTDGKKEVVKCLYCGANNEIENKKCSSCGARLDK